MKANFRYQSPDHQNVEGAIRKALIVGRNPGEQGLKLTPEDSAISAKAAEISVTANGITIRNTSSYAQIDVHHETGTRYLFPGEALETRSDTRVVIPGSVYSHQIWVEVSVVAEQPQHAASTTTRVGPEEFSIANERLPALIGLCAARFFPERLGSGLLTATKIAEVLNQNGHHVTAKAVNNKLQRIREDAADRFGVYLDSREELADWAIKNGYVTRSHVVGLFAMH